MNFQPNFAIELHDNTTSRTPELDFIDMIRDSDGRVGFQFVNLWPQILIYETEVRIFGPESGIRTWNSTFLDGKFAFLTGICVIFYGFGKQNDFFVVFGPKNG